MRGKLDPIYGSIGREVEMKPEISHFTHSVVVFQDGTRASVDSILLGTGYEIREPFFETGGVLTTDPSAKSNMTFTSKLVTNLRYLFPLHGHIMSLDPSHPPNALAFVGLPSSIAKIALPTLPKACMLLMQS